MTPFGIAGIQMNLQHGNNVDAIEEKINLLMCLYPWVEMVIVSELAAHGPLDSFSETMPGITENRFCAMAKKHNVWLIPGSFFELRNNVIFNTAPVINPQGEVIARHRKLFPFRPFEEGIEAGDEFVVFDVPGAGRFGLCICYDMWFPEVLRTLTSMGAEVILHPVLTGTNDRDIELNLARSSGALFQSYIIDVNGLGVGGIGQSCIIDPAGRVVYQAGATDEFLVTELDFDNVRRQREVGLRNLGQPLKSFRDSKIDFNVYNKTAGESRYLNSLGPLQKATRQSKAIKATEPAFIVNKELANRMIVDTDMSEPFIHQGSQLTGDLGINLSTELSTELSIEPSTELSIEPSIELSTVLSTDLSAGLSNDINATLAISEYNNLAIEPVVAIASIVTEQHLPLDSALELAQPTDFSTVVQSVIEQPKIAAVDESNECDLENKIGQETDTNTIKSDPSTHNDSSNISDEKSRSDNLKWLKDASMQIKQYIKS